MGKIKNVIVTGSTGMLGNNIMERFLEEKTFKMYGISRNNHQNSIKQVTHISLDLTDFDLLEKTLKEIKPDIIIHCAAIVNVDSCEKNKEDTYNLHVKATEILASYKPQNTKFIYISTDSVFDGEIGNYREIDNANPLNYYARTKFEGEKVAIGMNPNTIVVRTNIYGFHLPKSNSLAEWAIENLSNDNAINGFTDVYFNPVYVGELAEIVKKLCTEVNFKGILNVGSKEHISKYGFLKKLAQQFLFSEMLIHKALVDDIDFHALRPKNTTLNIDKLKELYNEIPSIEVGLANMEEDTKGRRKYDMEKNK